MNSRKAVLTAASLLLIIIFASALYADHGRVVGKLYAGGEEGNLLYIDKYNLTLKGTDKNGVTYYCLPAYADLTELDQSDSAFSLLLSDGTPLRSPLTGREQDILVDTGSGDPLPWRICFLRSENLCSLFINTTDTPMSGIEHDIYSGAEATLFSPTGSVLYSNKDIQIKGRGNATWQAEKKPYELKLPEKAGLCGLSASKKWTLLANYFEPTKLCNKLAFDTSDAIGLEYSIESDWIDLYANNEYLGNYLLCREPAIGSADLDISSLEKKNSPYVLDAEPFETKDMKGYDFPAPFSPGEGGFLIEKNVNAYYEKKSCGFKTLDNFFTIKSPDNASYGQVEYIKNFVTMVDDAIRSNSSDELSLIDTDTFTRRFILEELFFNDDAFVTSYYFYKKPFENVLYAGPVWDYDGTVGGGDGPYLNPEGTILEQRNYIAPEDMAFKNPLDWDVMLYDDKAYYDILVDVFHMNLPVLTDMVNDRMDSYYDRIRASVLMDYAIWCNGGGGGQYDTPDENYGFTKDFLTKRLDFLSHRWE